jgi:hypothetical protein
LSSSDKPEKPKKPKKPKNKDKDTMANDLSHNPLILDTPAVISATNKFTLNHIRLVPDGAAAARAVLEDGQGRVIAVLQAPAQQTDRIDHGPNNMHITGLELASISGAGAQVHVYCGE